MRRRMLNRRCTHIRREYADGRDEYGNKTPVVVSETPIWCYFERNARAGAPIGSERTVDRDTTHDDSLLVVDADHVIGPLDAFEVEGESGRFEVEGEPSKLWNPRTRRVDHIELTLVRVQ